MAHSSHKRWRGCCMMCGYHTLTGQGRKYKDPWAVQRKLGKSKRLTRKYLGDSEDN